MALFPPNLILYVPSQNVTLTYDKYGNPVESSAEDELYAFSVLQDSPELRANAGLDTATATYTGKCVGKLRSLTATNLLANENLDTRQKFLPPTVIANVKLKCIQVEPLSGKRHPGTFVVLSAFQSRYRVVTKVLGSKLQGYFELGR